MPRTEADTRRELIDSRLEAASWIVKDRPQMNLFVGRGIVVPEFPLQNGYADSIRIVDCK